MSKQVNFYLTDVDVRELFAKIFPVSDFAFINKYESSGNISEIVNKEVIYNVDGGVLYICARCDIGEVIMKQIDGNKWRVDDMVSPVIEYNKCQFLDGKLRRGRVFFTEKFYMNGNLYKKNSAFIKKASAAMKSIKRSLRAIKIKQLSGDYIGSDAIASINGSGGVLSDGLSEYVFHPNAFP